MAIAAWGIQIVLSHVALSPMDHLPGQFLTLIAADGTATIIYLGLIVLFKVEEIRLVKSAVLARLTKR